MRRLLPFLFVLIIGCGPTANVPAASPSSRPAATTVLPIGGTQTVTYCTNDGQALAMDISLPAPRPAAPAPAVLYVHGGGWEHGDRRGGGFLAQLRPALLARGFVVASIDYRLAPAHPWPAQIVDAKCAVRYLRANAALYGIDTERIGAWGGSAGGHLVSLLGTADAAAGYDIGEWSDRSSRVAAVVDLFGPSDLTSGGWNADPTRTITAVFGSPPGSRDPILVAASPVTWVSGDDPPFLILHGDADLTVPVAQSEQFAAKLRSAGVPTTLVVVRSGPHGLASSRQQPAPEQLVATILEFFTRTLKA